MNYKNILYFGTERVDKIWHVRSIDVECNGDERPILIDVLRSLDGVHQNVSVLTLQAHVCLYQLVRVLASPRSDVGCSSCPCLQTYVPADTSLSPYLHSSLLASTWAAPRFGLPCTNGRIPRPRSVTPGLCYFSCACIIPHDTSTRVEVHRNNFLLFCLLKTASYYARFNTLQQLASLATHYSTQHLRRRPDAVGLGLKNHRLSLTRRQPILM
jgi:hypothetical protein